MPKKSKGKHRLDKFYHLAKEQGYRSRAAFKLIQLNKQFRFLGKVRTCLDLCAAPGGWMQVAAKEMPLNSFILGIDLDPIKPIRGCKSIVGDITTTKARAAIKKESAGQRMEVVLHDGAPNVGGVWASEAYSQSALVLEALRLATDVLIPQGTFVTKIFRYDSNECCDPAMSDTTDCLTYRSQDYNALLFAFKQLFNKVEATKPAASRNTSAEIFVVCIGYRAPAKIDPRLLDPKHLFKEIEAACKPLGPDALLKQKVKQKRFREGYAEGLSSLFKQTTAAAFIASDQPVDMLGQYTRFSLDDPEAEEEQAWQSGNGTSNLAAIAELARTHSATSTEICTLLDDLQVLGRSEFKQLLKWRLNLKKALDLKKTTSLESSQPSAKESEESEEDEEGKLIGEIQEVKALAEQRQRREKKKRLESKKKARIRSAQLAIGEGIADENGPSALFSLAAISIDGKDGGFRVDQVEKVPSSILNPPMLQADVSAAGLGQDVDVPDEDAPETSQDEAEQEVEEEEYDSDEAQRKYEADQEEAMEEAYQNYLERKGHRAQVAFQKRARLKKEKPGDVLDQPLADFDSSAAPRDPVTFPEQLEVGGGLLVGTGPKLKSPAELAKDWYSQDVFKEFDDLTDTQDAPQFRRSRLNPLDSSDSESQEVEVEDLEELMENGAAQVGKNAASNFGKEGAREGDFEIVPHDAANSDESSDSDIEEPEQEEAAEIRAVAQAMLKGRRKNDIIEHAYHRYAFHDTNLPKWFQEDEEKHMRPPAVVSREEVEAEKERMQAVDARPTKKIAEAKARKKRRLQVRLEQARSKATSIVEQGDLSERAKAKEVAKLYAQAKSGPKKKRKPARSDKFKKKGPPLDRRLMSDKRQVNNKKKKAAAKTRKKGGAKNKGKG